MAQNDLFSVRMKWNVATHPASCILHYRQVSTQTSSTLDYCNALDFALRENGANPNFFQAQDCTFEGWTIRKITGPKSPPKLSQLEDAVGLQPGQSLPLSKAVVVRQNIFNGDARRRGRIYLPGITEGATDKNIVTAQATLNNIEAYFNAIRTMQNQSQGETWDWQMVVKEAKPAAAGPLFWDVSVCRAQNIIYSQRRRTTTEWGSVPD